jgi:hypothetical protein
VILCIDELVDGGMILETDPGNIVSRVLMRGVSGQGELPLTELTIGQVGLDPLWAHATLPT